MMKIFLYLIPILSYGCTSDSGECPKNQACTENFVSICIKIQKENQQNYYPALVEMEFQSTGVKRTVSPTPDFNGYYCLVNDTDLTKINKNGTWIDLVLKDDGNNEIWTERYLIGHDCCHVLKLQGRDTITLK